MMQIGQKNWQRVVGAAVVVISVGALVARATDHFVLLLNTQTMNSSVALAAQRMDDFFEFTARNLLFQRTNDIFQDLLDPQKRPYRLHYSSAWIDEMRKSASADFWVVLDERGRIVVSLPSVVNPPLWRPIWKASLRNYQCNTALLADAKGEPAFMGIGVDLIVNDKKRGELWLLYRIESVSQLFFSLHIPASFELATVKGKTLWGSKHPSLANISKPLRFHAGLKEAPLLLVVNTSPSALTENASLLRLLYWSFLLILAFAVALIMNQGKRAAGRDLAVKLTEIFHSLSERFLETKDAEEVFQALAEAIAREFRFPIAIVFRYDKQSQRYLAAGYVPRQLLHKVFRVKGEGPDGKLFLSMSTSISQKLQSGAAYISPNPCEFFEDCRPEEICHTLQNLLRLRLNWCALLFAEGNPVGALFVGTSREQFTDEELQALELVRQQAAMLLTMISSWEEQEEAQKRASRFQEVLLKLSKEIPQRKDLLSKLELIAREAREALEVSRVNIWQVHADQQSCHCLVAVGDDSEQLVGTVLPLNRYQTYMTSLEETLVIAVDSVSTDPRTSELTEDYWRPQGIEATMDVPIRIEGKVVGIVCCEHKTPRKWSNEEINFAADIADFVARAILESQQQRRERYLTTLSQLTLQLLVVTDWQEVLPIFLEDMGKVAGSDRAFVAQLVTDENGREILRCLSVWSVDGLVEGEREFLLDEVGTPYQIDALRMGKPVLAIVQTLPEPYRQFYEQRGVKAILAVPILVESRLWGVLGFSARRAKHQWDEADITALRIAGGLLGSVIERQNAVERQIEQERQFRRLVENAVVGIYRSTPEGKLIMANPALAKMFGYDSPEEMVSSITDLATQVYTNPANREYFKRMIDEQGFVQNFIVPARRKDGKVIWVSLSGRGIYSQDGKLLYYEGFVLDITAQKQAEEQLRRRLEQLQSLYLLSLALQRSDELSEIASETMRCLISALKCDKAAVWLVDDDGKLRIKAAYEIPEGLKQTLEEIYAQPGAAYAATPIMVNNVERASYLGQLQEVLLEEGIRSGICLPILDSKERLLGRLSVYFSHPHEFTKDEFELLQTIAHHFSFAIVRNEVQEKLRHSERKFRSIFENAVVGIYRSTPEGRFLMANETLARIHGYDSVEEIMALDIPSQIYLNPEDRERFKKLMVERGSVANYRYPIKRKDGSIGWLTKWSRAVKDENGNVLYYEGFVLDITERVQLEQRLKALQATARSLVMRLDIESIIRTAVTEISNLYPGSAVLVFRYRGENDLFVLEEASNGAEDLLRTLRLSIGSTLKRHRFHALEERLMSGSGFLISDITDAVGSSVQETDRLGYRSVFIRGIGDSSRLWGMIAVFGKGEDFAQHDVDFLNSFCDYLSIAVRNASLFQQVRQSYEELRAIQEKMIEQERIKALGQIASGIAHDINNALVPIQGFAEILMDHSDPVVRNAAEMIFKSADAVAATVQRMREFYKARGVEETLVSLDLNSICKDALDMTRPRWFNMPREKGIVIETRLKLSDDLPTLVGIPGEICQAIVNLIINAVDAMPEGGVLTIQTYRRDKGGRAWAVVEVSDTGIGMDEETRRRAIEPFFTTKGERGTGLGLTAVYGIVQKHEGFMEIDSELGKGTTVRLWFPSNIVQTVELPEGEVPSLRLLVIDDEPSVREVLALLLRRDGHIVSTAADGEEGLELFQTAQLQGKPFNVVITDLGMPKMDGMVVARKIKAISPNTPVVLLSGWGFKIRSEEAEVIDLVLTKPVNSQQIRNALSQIWKLVTPSD